jgi:FtsH ternary system domain X1
VTAVSTAARVLSWAAEPAGPPPTGPLWEPAGLARPPAAVADAAAQLARRTAALLGAGSPPFGGRNRIGPGVLFLAAAVGGRQQAGPAARLAQAIPPGRPHRDPNAWYDLIARYGLVGPAVSALDGAEPALAPAHPAPARPEPEAADRAPGQPLPELLLDASPLTAVLYRPSLRAIKSDATGHAVNAAVALLGRPRGQAVLADGLAGCSLVTSVLAWRADLLARLRHDHQDLLLDVYLVARTRFAAEWDERVAWAARQIRALARGGPSPVDPLAIATLRFWAPLAAIERAGGPLSALRPLLTGQDRALRAVRAFRLDQAGAA